MLEKKVRSYMVRSTMELFVSTLFSSVVQLVLFSVVPFVWWLVRNRQTPFFQWIGLKKVDVDNGKAVRRYIVSLSLVFIVLSIVVLSAFKNVPMATDVFRGLGGKAIPAILVYAGIGTALSEEVLFRGFLLKRLQGVFGFLYGNTIQALLFGLVHGVLFFYIADVFIALVATVFTVSIAWGMGYVNEKKAGGSILPSWIIYCVSNVFSGICSAFLIL